MNYAVFCCYISVGVFSPTSHWIPMNKSSCERTARGNVYAENLREIQHLHLSTISTNTCTYVACTLSFLLSRLCKSIILKHLCSLVRHKLVCFICFGLLIVFVQRYRTHIQANHLKRRHICFFTSTLLRDYVTDQLFKKRSSRSKKVLPQERFWG